MWVFLSFSSTHCPEGDGGRGGAEGRRPGGSVWWSAAQLEVGEQCGAPPQHSLCPKWALWAQATRLFPVDMCLSRSVPGCVLSIFFSLLSSSPSIPFYPITPPSASQPDPRDFLPSGSCTYLSSPFFPACLNSEVAISPSPWCPPGLPSPSAGSPPSELQQCVFHPSGDANTTSPPRPRSHLLSHREG